MGNDNIDNKYRLENLEIYTLSKELVLGIYGLTKDFPSDERYGLTSQVRRSASSVGANIAEGHGRYHYKVEIKFCYQARGSLFETLFHLEIARDLKYISQRDFQDLYSKIRNLSVKLNNYIKYLRNRSLDN